MDVLNTTDKDLLRFARILRRLKNLPVIGEDSQYFEFKLYKTTDNKATLVIVIDDVTFLLRPDEPTEIFVEDNINIGLLRGSYGRLLLTGTKYFSDIRMNRKNINREFIFLKFGSIIKHLNYLKKVAKMCSLVTNT